MTTRFILTALLSLCALTALLSFWILTAKSRADQPGAAKAGGTGGYILHAEEGEVLLLGSPPGRVIIKVDPAKTGSPQMAMGIQYVEQAIPVHLHEHEEEFLFVHRGQGVGILGQERIPVQAGTTIYIPPGTWHGLENTGGEASQVMWVVTPGDGKTTQLEHFFREAGSPPGEPLKSFTLERLIDRSQVNKASMSTATQPDAGRSSPVTGLGRSLPSKTPSGYGLQREGCIKAQRDHFGRHRMTVIDREPNFGECAGPCQDSHPARRVSVTRL